MSVFQIFSFPAPDTADRKPAPPPRTRRHPGDSQISPGSPPLRTGLPRSRTLPARALSATVPEVLLLLWIVSVPAGFPCRYGGTGAPGQMNGGCEPGSGRFVVSYINRYLMTIDDPLQIFDTSAKYRFWDIRKSDRFSGDSVPRLLTQNYQFNMHMGGTSGPTAWNHLLPVRCSAPQFVSLYIVTRCTAILRRHSRQRCQDWFRVYARIAEVY
jgi:hypothetical protein